MGTSEHVTVEIKYCDHIYLYWRNLGWISIKVWSWINFSYILNHFNDKYIYIYMDLAPLINTVNWIKFTVCVAMWFKFTMIYIWDFLKASPIPAGFIFEKTLPSWYLEPWLHNGNLKNLYNLNCPRGIIDAGATIPFLLSFVHQHKGISQDQDSLLVKRRNQTCD